MTRDRRSGARWRVLVHERTENNNDRYGRSHHVGSEAREIGQDTNLVQFHHLPRTDFDELVVGSGPNVWLHIEEQDTGSWWMCVGGVVIWVRVDRDGRPRLVDVHMPPGERDPEPGCTYEVTGGSSVPAGTVNTDTPHQEKQ